MPDIPGRSRIKKGLRVAIETKRDQGTGNLTYGAVESILTSSSFHPHGIKVRLQNGSVGRVKRVVDSAPAALARSDPIVGQDGKG